MPIDPRIALGYQPPQFESPVNMMRQMQVLQSGQQENQLRQAQMENYQAEAARRNALLPYDIAKAQGDAATAGLTRSKSQAELAAKKTESYMSLLPSFAANPNSLSAWLTMQHNDPDMAGTPVHDQPLDVLLAKIPRDPQGFTTHVQQTALGMANWIKDNKPTFENQDLGGSRRTIAIPGLGGAATVVPGSTALVTRSPNAAQGTTVNVAAPGKKFGETLGENAAKQLDTYLTQAQSAQSSLATSEQLASLINSKEFISGTLGDARLVVAKALGLKGAEETQTYFAAIGQQVAERIKAFGAGTGLSDSDRAYAQKIAGGSTELTQDAIKRIVRINDESARRVINNYRERRTFLSKTEPSVINYYPDIDAGQGGLGVDHSKKTDDQILAELGISPVKAK